MYKCECGAIFEEPIKRLEDTGETWRVCPNCKETDFYEARQCGCCNEYFEEDEMYGNTCDKCLENKYTDELGLKYIGKHKDFFLHHYGVEKVDKDLKNDLIEVLEKDYMSKIDLDTDWNHKLEYLKEYILDDLYDWNEFLKEEV